MATYKKINVDIGLESEFTKLPAEVTVGDWSYFLARNRKGVYQLLSNVCPHQAVEVVDWTGVFMCPRSQQAARRPAVGKGCDGRGREVHRR